MKQLKLNLYKGRHGGVRPKVGRKRIHSKGVAHRTREKMNHRTPLHINFKVTEQIQNKKCLKMLKKAVRNSRRFGLKIIHFSLQSNHIHLIIEADNNDILTRGMRSFTITFAKNVNKGRIQKERYHLHVLKTPTETKNALYYVLFNEQKHKNLKRAYVTEYSSLGLVKDLKKLSVQTKITIIPRVVPTIYLSNPDSWLLRKFYS